MADEDNVDVRLTPMFTQVTSVTIGTQTTDVQLESVESAYKRMIDEQTQTNEGFETVEDISEVMDLRTDRNTDENPYSHTDENQRIVNVISSPYEPLVFNTVVVSTSDSVVGDDGIMDTGIHNHNSSVRESRPTKRKRLTRPVSMRVRVFRSSICTPPSSPGLSMSNSSTPTTDYERINMYDFIDHRIQVLQTTEEDVYTRNAMTCASMEEIGPSIYESLAIDAGDDVRLKRSQLQRPAKAVLLLLAAVVVTLVTGLIIYRYSGTTQVDVVPTFAPHGKIVYSH